MVVDLLITQARHKCDVTLINLFFSNVYPVYMATLLFKLYNAPKKMIQSTLQLK